MCSFTSLKFIRIPTSRVKANILCAKELDNSIVDSESLNGSVTPINANVANRQPGVLDTIKAADR